MASVPWAYAFVTGASSGLGRALVLWLTKRGVKVFAAARRAEELETLRAEAPAGYVMPVVVDVTDAEAAARAVRDADERSGGLDLVVANAGVSGRTDAKKLEWQQVEKIIDVNVTGAAATLTAALPGMVSRNHGHIVGIASVAALRGLPSRAAYSGSKAFLRTFLEGLRVDLRGTEVAVSCIQPGWIDTPLVKKNPFKMPFIMSVERAAEITGRAMLEQRREYTFPWQMAVVIKILSWLPNWLFDRLVGAVPR